MTTAEQDLADTITTSDPRPQKTNGNPSKLGQPAYSDIGENFGRPSKRVTVTESDGSTYELDHGRVAIASITSCTNTSNPEVMLAAGLLARNATKKGLQPKPWLKTSMGPGSRVVTSHYNTANLG